MISIIGKANLSVNESHSIGWFSFRVIEGRVFLALIKAF